MYKIQEDKDVEKKYDFRIKAHVAYKNDSKEDYDLNGKILNLKDKYKSVKGISGSIEDNRFIISFNNNASLNDNINPLLTDLDNITKEYLINQGVCDDDNNCRTFDYSSFSTFIEIRL